MSRFIRLSYNEGPREWRNEVFIYPNEERIMVETSESRFPHPIQSDHHIHIAFDFTTPLGFNPSKPSKPMSGLSFEEFLAESAALIEESQRRKE